MEIKTLTVKMAGNGCPSKHMPSMRVWELSKLPDSVISMGCLPRLELGPSNVVRSLSCCAILQMGQMMLIFVALRKASKALCCTTWMTKENGSGY